MNMRKHFTIEMIHKSIQLWHTQASDMSRGFCGRILVWRWWKTNTNLFQWYRNSQAKPRTKLFLKWIYGIRNHTRNWSNPTWMPCSRALANAAGGSLFAAHTLYKCADNFWMGISCGFDIVTYHFTASWRCSNSAAHFEVKLEPTVDHANR